LRACWSADFVSNALRVSVLATRKYFSPVEWHPIVAIPARNEAERIPALIGALGQQSWMSGHGRRLPVILVVNNSDDDSAEVAAKAAVAHPNLMVDIVEVDFPPETAHVGSARRLAMDRAAQMAIDPCRSVLLTTDADATPTPTWVDANLGALEAGADVVGGHIAGDEVEEARLGAAFLRRAAQNARYTRLVDRLAALIDPVPYDPWPRHSDHTGASLAVRADIYAAVGGMTPLPSREDLSFVSRVRSAGYRLRHAPDVSVKVSARLEGRARGGMADCIQGWVWSEARGLPHLVENPGSIVARLRRRRSARELAHAERLKLRHSGRGSNGIRKPPIPESELSIHARIEVVAPDEPDAPAGIPVELAISEIEGIIANMESESRVSRIVPRNLAR
jgi:hypothetical protein